MPPNDAQWEALVDVTVADINERYDILEGEQFCCRGRHRESNVRVTLNVWTEAEVDDDCFEERRLEISLLREARKVDFGATSFLGQPYFHEACRSAGRLYIVLTPLRGAAAIPRVIPDGAGAGVHDVYGFETVIMPSLTTGVRLVVKEQELAPDDNRSAGAGVWNGTRPAVTTLCRWQLSIADKIRGKAVLELGAGARPQ